MSQEPLNPQRLVTILAHLLPPAYPLAPDLLSSAIKTRQLYLPPNPSNPSDDRFIAQRPRPSHEPSTGEQDPDPEELSKRLKAIADSRLHARDPEFSNEVQLQGEGNEIEVALYREAWNVRYRALDGETVVGKLDLMGVDGEQGVRVLFFPEAGEGETEDSARIERVGDSADVAYRSQISMGNEWKLFDVKLLEECLAEEARSTSPINWAASPREALEALKGENEGEVGGEDQEEEDFWGGYSDEEKEEPEERSEKSKSAAPTPGGLPPPAAIGTSSLPAKSYTNSAHPTQPTAPTTKVSHDTLSDLPATIINKKVTISPFVSRFNTPIHHADDAYWSSYGGVEDGLKVSNPPSPRGVSRFSTPGVEGGYWGTGGETPISWSPPPPTQGLPAVPGQAATPKEPILQDPSTEYHVQLQQAATKAEERTDAMFASHDGHVDLSSPGLDFAPGSPAEEPVEGETPAADERQTALRAALSGLKFMYLNTSTRGADQNQLQVEFADVLREFM
ncbi:hypothetical protein QFC20_005618 [Naganishia adeliensis]|uniref:Uncharacterized protein n=1 Tax=Naganishia adeliensis TaxID=92952 RepID=A0ACC2VM51_9TREE|nr:hypothetical protein QFC20_005618 [Naganishia adeliensis]